MWKRAWYSLPVPVDGRAQVLIGQVLCACWSKSGHCLRHHRVPQIHLAAALSRLHIHWHRHGDSDSSNSEDSPSRRGILISPRASLRVGVEPRATRMSGPIQGCVMLRALPAGPAVGRRALSRRACDRMPVVIPSRRKAQAQHSLRGTGTTEAGTEMGPERKATSESTGPMDRT